MITPSQKLWKQAVWTVIGLGLAASVIGCGDAPRKDLVNGQVVSSSSYPSGSGGSGGDPRVQNSAAASSSSAAPGGGSGADPRLK